MPAASRNVFIYRVPESNVFFEEAYKAARSAVSAPERLAAVLATGLLDTEVEESFDRLTRLAVRLLRVPAAFVSLVDEKRDFYKSAKGFGEPLATTRQLEGPTFCHFAIQQDAPLVIADTRAHPVYRSVPTVESLGVAAYIGVPLVVNDQRIGSFCVIDVEPHAWTADEIAILDELAAVAIGEISLRSARADAERYRAEFEEANRVKSEFLAAMSHDLRTPLNAIGGHAQLMEMGVQGPVTEAQMLSLGRIIRAQKHLLALINDILQFARIEGGGVSLTRENIDIGKICTDLTSILEPMAKEKEIEFSCEVAPASKVEGATILVSDAERIIQILVNLATNAVKFTESGGRVSVRAAHVPDWVEFQVSDTGRGIPPDDLSRIFEPFAQVAGEDRHSGIGLGLASSRNLSRLLGGDILVSSIPGTGSTFTLRLPLSPFVRE